MSRGLVVHIVGAAGYSFLEVSGNIMGSPVRMEVMFGGLRLSEATTSAGGFDLPGSGRLVTLSPVYIYGGFSYDSTKKQT